MTSSAAASDRAPAPLVPVLAAALVVVGIWGGTPIVTKLAVAEVPPTLVGMLRTVLALPLALLLLFGSRFPPLAGRQWALAALSGLGGFVIFPILFSLGQARTSGAHGGLILASLPVITGLVAAAAARQWPAGRWLLGAAIAMAGELVLMSFGGGLLSRGAPSEATLAGDALVLLSAFACGSGYVAGAYLARDIGARAATYWSLSLAGVALLPFALWQGTAVDWAQLSAATWVSLLYLAVLSSILAYVLWFWALDVGGIARVATAQFLQPVVSLGLAAWILSETISVELVLATLIILAGVAICQRARTT